MREIEAAFGTTAQLLLGKKLSGLDDYVAWLETDLFARIGRAKSIKSEKGAVFPAVDMFRRISERMLTQEEALEHGRNAITAAEAEGLSLGNAAKILGKISATTVEIVWGTNIGVEECGCYGPCQYCYRSALAWFDKLCACSFWPRTSEYCFGVSRVLDCKFCMKCYDSTNLTRCFEVSDATNCSDLYFCHNVENVHESMFCFNTKNKRFAIGNVEVGRERYMELKKVLRADVGGELEEKKNFRRTVFNLGSGK